MGLGNSPNLQPLSVPAPEDQTDWQAEGVRFAEGVWDLANYQQEEPQYNPDDFAAYPQEDLYSHPLVQAYDEAVMSGDTVSQLGIQTQLAREVMTSSLNQAVDQAIGAEREQQQLDAYAAAVEKLASNKYGPGWKDVKDDLANALQRNPQLMPDVSDANQAAEQLAVLARAVKQQVDDKAIGPQFGYGGRTPEAADVLQAMMRRA